jgi:glutamine synthetase
MAVENNIKRKNDVFWGIIVGMSEVRKIIQKENVNDIALQFTDTSGVLRSLWVPAELLSKIAEGGIHVDGSSVGMASISKSDMKLLPDLDTFVVLPTNLFPQRAARVICDLCQPDSNRLSEFSPRYVLKKVMDDLRKTLGGSVKYHASSEMEYFLFKKSENGDIRLLDEGGYLATPPADLGVDLRLEIVRDLRNMGVLVEKHHHEVPPGKYELELGLEWGIGVGSSDALGMADTLYLVKFIVKLMASRRELTASFMPKPFQGQYGAGLHTHATLVDDERTKNLFYESDGIYGLSKTGLNFIAGILAHAKALAALTNPSVNSYKRLVPGWEAPVYIAWARYNRSALIRIPPGKGMKTRIEYRPTDGSCNFYVAFAGILAAGLDGIRRKIAPPDPVEEDVYQMSEKERAKRGIDVLPGNLGDALNEFSMDDYLQDSLGRAFCERFLQLKTKEWKDFNLTVHDWERKKYLDV